MLNKPKLISVCDILNMDFGEDEWLINDLIPVGTLTVISGQPSSFKSWTAMHIAQSVTIGNSFLGHFGALSRRKVLILDKENILKEIQTRYRALGVLDDGSILYDRNDDLHFDNKEDVESIIQTIETENIDVVIVDSLRGFHRGDENDSRQISTVMRNFKKIVNDTGANVIFIHHHRKEPANGRMSSNSLRGSSDILAQVDSHFALTRYKKGGSDIIVFSHLKSRQNKTVEDFEVKVISDETKNTFEFKFVGKFDSQKEKRENVMKAIIEVFFEETKEALSLKDIEDSFGDEYSKNLIRTALSELCEKGVIKKTVKEHGKAFYSLVEGEE